MENFRLRSTAALAALAMSVALSMAISPSASAIKLSDWSTPVHLGDVINSDALDTGPAISRDGLSLYFSSNRGAEQLFNFDVYVSQRPTLDAAWGPAENLGPTINTEFFDGVPALSRDEHWLFFTSNRPGGFGGPDIWVSFREHVHDDFAWETPINLGEGVNSPFFDAGASYFENDDVGVPLLFFGSDRPGGPGGLSIYVSAQQPDASFGPAELVEELSSPFNDQRPVIRFDGLELFFTSDRPGSVGIADIWVSTRGSVSDPWSTPVNLGPTVNSPGIDAHAYISSDRKTLFFFSSRPGGVGSWDLYMTTRTLAPPGLSR